jgi:hypothetical protein
VNNNFSPKQTLMQIGIRIAACALLLSTFWWACKDIDLYEVPGGREGNITFSGRIIDEAFQPVVGAQVYSGTANTVTDANGVFRLQTINASTENAILHVKKQGYFDFSRAFSFSNNTQTSLTIQLLAKNQSFTFDASSGLAISFSGGLNITFPANAIAYAGGQAYNGQVYAYGRYLDPEDALLALHMPGDLRGIDASGEEKVLTTYGMFVVELYSSAGDLLHIAAGKQAEISMPVPSTLSGSAPASIPLWYYDLEQARWVEEGSAQRVGNTYVGKVSHFSFWNCDFPESLIKLSGKVFVGNNENPAAGALITILDVNTGFNGFGYVNADGTFCGYVPKNAPLNITIELFSGTCINQVYGPTGIGPFSGDAQLPDIIVTPPQNDVISVEGLLVDCNQQAVSDGYAAIWVNDYQYSTFAFTDANGHFSVAFPVCPPIYNIKVVGLDLTNVNKSDTFYIYNPTALVDVGTLTACTALDQYFRLKINGNQYLLPYCGGIRYDTGGSGYTYISGEGNTLGFGYLTFPSDAQTGTFNVTSFVGFGINMDSTIAPNLNATITTYGAVGQYIEGNVLGTVVNTQGQTVNLDGQYRAVRSQ